MQLETYSEKAIKDMGLKGPSQGIHFNFTLYMMILFMIFNVIQITKGEKEKDRNNIVKDSIRQGIIIFLNAQFNLKQLEIYTDHKTKYFA